MTGQPAKIVLIACGAIGREIRAVMAVNEWEHLTLLSLPAALHNAPDKIPGAVREAIGRVRDKGGRPVVAYADCGTGGLLDRLCVEEDVERIPGPHCYSFFSGNAVFEAAAEEDMTTFYLTDYLASNFDKLIWEDFGVNRRPDLVEFLFGRYEKLVYLAQTDDDTITAKAHNAAERLSLPFERRFTGYGDLAAFVAQAAQRPS